MENHDSDAIHPPEGPEVEPLSEGRSRATLADLDAHAPALVDLARVDPTLLPAESELTLPVSRNELLAALEEECDERGLLPGLRRVRHRSLIRVALREVRRLADVDQTSAELAALASACLEVAQRRCRVEVAKRFGDAVNPYGQPIAFVIMGMGKLGGGELNLGSDVDLCFFYGTDDGEVQGGETSVHDFFTRVARKVSAALGEVTEHGFVFRVDLRLRPEGSQGALVNSLQSAERYYQEFGRPWERAVWLRAQPVAGDFELGSTLRQILQPFIFPKRVDPSIATSMHDMVERSRRELGDEREHDVKLGRGGIREAEFFIQGLQLIWGGANPSLQVSGTVQAARRLEALGFISSGEYETLTSAWALLRRVEHRIHMTMGYQTHRLPTGSSRELFAASLGYESGAALLAALEGHEAKVADLFDSLLPANQSQRQDPATERLLDACAERLSPDEVAKLIPDVLEVHDTSEAAVHLLRWSRLPEAPLGPLGRKRTPQLARKLLQAISEAAAPDLALRHLTDFLTRSGPTYSKRLEDDDRLTRRLVGLLGSSPAFAAALVGFPDSLATLLSGTVPTDATIAEDHLAVPDDFEHAIRFLRDRKRTNTLQIGLAFFGDDLDFDGSARQLSALADAQIQAALKVAVGLVGVSEAQHDSHELAVVAVGKLGSQELGFGSDLDLFFVHHASDPFVAADLAKVAQKLMRVLSCIDPSGVGYEVDTRLRPSGAQGTLVTSLAGLRRYHETKGKGWERQALVRARVVAATSTAFADRVASALVQLAFEGAAPAGAEVARLRARMESELAGEDPHRYDAKLGYGALVDVEFIAQWLQMGHQLKERPIRHTDAALKALADASVLPSEEAGKLRQAGRFFSHVLRAQHLLIPRGDARVGVGGPRALATARMLGLRERDGIRPADVLMREWRALATSSRALFEKYIGEVGTEPPWSKGQP